MLQPHDEAAAILGHYLAQFAQAAGFRWSEQNQADIQRAAELLAEAEAEPEALPELPPYRPAPAPEPRPIVSDRQTIVLDTPIERQQWADFRRWQMEKYAQEQDDQSRRILRHGGRG